MEKNHEQSIMADETKVDEYAKSYSNNPFLAKELGKKDLQIEKLQSQVDGWRKKTADERKKNNTLLKKETLTHNDNVALQSKVEELKAVISGYEVFGEDIRRNVLKDENAELKEIVKSVEKQFNELKDNAVKEFDALLDNTNKQIDILKKEIYTKDCEYGTLTDIKKVDVLSQQISDYWNCLDKDELKGLGYENGAPLEHKDYVFYLHGKLASGARAEERCEKLKEENEKLKAAVNCEGEVEEFVNRGFGGALAKLRKASLDIQKLKEVNKELKEDKVYMEKQFNELKANACKGFDDLLENTNKEKLRLKGGIEKLKGAVFSLAPLKEENEELKEEIDKLKEEIEEDNECEKLIMEIWAESGDRDKALPIHYRQKKKNGEWGIDEEEE